MEISDKVSDEGLILKVLCGQTEAFSELVTRYQAAVFAVTLQMTKSFEDAKDLAQEVFLKAYLRGKLLFVLFRHSKELGKI